VGGVEAEVTDEELSDITAEKSLFDVYRNIVRRLPGKRVYQLIVILVFAAVLTAAIASDAPLSVLSKLARDWSAAIFNFAATVLGILLAGFSIFSTIAGTDLVEPLATIRDPKSGRLSYLKVTAGRFMEVFIWYVLFLIFYAIVMLFGWEGGPATMLARWLSRVWGTEVARIVTAIGLSIVGAFFAKLIVVLQSFVFNVYASFMFMARGKLHIEDNKRKKDAEEAIERKELYRVLKIRIAESAADTKEEEQVEGSDTATQGRSREG
jgi:hypothetical protein